jgi:predicted RNA-binding Zn ribbon-like protein
MSAGELPLVGGHLAIDFVNTLSGTIEQPSEQLRDYADLLAWTRHVGLIDTPLADELARQARRHRQDAEAAVVAVVALRTHLDTALRARVAGREAPADLAALVSSYRRALARARLIPTGDGYAWVWPADRATLDDLRWRLAVHAMDLLHHAPLDQLRHCAGCRYLFLDHSKNHSRRWCRMRGCGDNAKMRRYRARKRD